jgi:flagellar basal-body rod modification protein FlgD
MAISAVGASSAAATPAASGIGLQDFLKILLTQLNYQDPLKPVDNQAFMAQMAQFTALEQTQRLNDRLDLLIANQAALQSIGLIGRTVDVATESGNVTGTVASLSLQGEQPKLSVNTSDGRVLADLNLSQVSAVR